jgi:glycosyltransferase involved in cell wall biosynthesis
MNVGIVVDNEINNDKRILREIEILKENGMRIYVIGFGFDKKKYREIEGIIISRISIKKKIKDILFFLFNRIPLYEWLWASKIKKFVLKNKIEILHVHDLYMAKSSHRGAAKSKRNIPLILDLHENYPYAVSTYNWTKGFLRSLIAAPELWRKKELEYLDYADKIVVLSNNYSTQLLIKYPSLAEKQFCVFPNYPDLKQMNSFRIQKEIIPFTKTSPIIFYFGIIAERRGIFNALEAFRKVIKEANDATFLIIGPIDKVDKKRFDNILKAPDVSNKLIYIPWIDLSELPTYLEISDICIAPFLKNPQHESGIANKIFDYMLGKKPIIASDCIPQQELIERYNCGLVYHNEYELINAMIRLLNDSRIRMEMGENGYNAIIKEHNSGAVKGNLIEMYESLFNEKNN